jgi:tRNA-dihydrouridine synthase B
VNCVDVARAAEAGGAAAVALHGRTRAQGYAGSADWSLIRAVKEGVGIPVLGSGDVWSAADAVRMRRETGCDAVLVARGACGHPWIFRDLRALERGDPAPGAPTRDEWVGTVMRHVRLQVEHRTRRDGAAGGEEGAAVRTLRKHLLWYTRGLRGGVHFRREAVTADTVESVERLLDRHFPPGAPFRIDPTLLATEALAE